MEVNYKTRKSTIFIVEKCLLSIKVVKVVNWYYTGLSKMMSLVSTRNIFYDKRDIEMGFAVTFSKTHKVFLNNNRTPFLHVLHAQKIC